MKVALRSVNADEMPSRWAMCFENGLVMQSPSFLWTGKEEREKIRNSFNVVVAEMGRAGFEIEDCRTK